jgi:hypothetical protein
VDTGYLPEFQGVYFEDSYFLGIVAEGCDLRLKMLFALTVDHPAYQQPKAGEQHCYREGSILIQRPTLIEMQPGTPTVLTDPDGSLDFGSVELYRQSTSGFRVVTEWFEATMAPEQVTLQLT